jgi:carbamoyl-phosphate synthase large subunit
LISAGPESEKLKFLPWAKKLSESGLTLYGTEGTAKFLTDHGVNAQAVAWPGESNGIDPIELIRSKTVDLVLNIPKNLQRDELTRGAMMRQAATRFGCPVLTNMEKMIAYAQAITFNPEFSEKHQPKALPDYR